MFGSWTDGDVLHFGSGPDQVDAVNPLTSGSSIDGRGLSPILQQEVDAGL
jgi:hypothetical protein